MGQGGNFPAFFHHHSLEYIPVHMRKPGSSISAENLSVKDFLTFGYFPNGLPPCFSTRKFAEVAENDNLGKIWEDFRRNDIPNCSTPTKFLIPKRNLHRRVTSIANPIHQTVLTKFLVDNWDTVWNFLQSSTLSLSKPKKDTKQYRYLRPSIEHRELGEYRARRGSTYRHALHLDLHVFYPSVYTHSIEWALCGKEYAKKQFSQGNRSGKKSVRKGKKSLLLDFAKKLGKFLQSTNRNETRGLLIGPDTSLVVAEIIGTAIDVRLHQQWGRQSDTYQGYRHVDDMVFYCNSREDAHKLLETVRAEALEYHLHVNEVKSRLVELPEEPGSLWTYQLSHFEFPRSKKLYAYKNFFSLAFELQKKHPNDLVLKYALQIIRPFKGKKNLKNIAVTEEKEWEFLESMLCQSILFRPESIVIVHDIVNWYRKNRAGICKLEALGDALNALVASIPSEHDFEIAWALWMMKVHEITVSKKAADVVSRSTCPVVILLGLCLNKSGLGDNINVRKWETLFQSRKNNYRWLLYDSPYWLLVYEAAMSGWLGLDARILDQDQKGFGHLKKHEVRFFDCQRELTEDEIDFGVSPRGIGGIARTYGA